MKPIVLEWIEKAEADFATLGREMRARKEPNYDGACFHAQQCIEKYMKALLTELHIAFPRTHDLVALLDLMLERAPHWEVHREDMAFLSEYSVHYRYPGTTADKPAAMNAHARCMRMRNLLRSELKL
jgi:HEPN domain-containing protein